uniref:Uncharacterized protein n=1 Tax=Meloidogyne enterolobii TaxID=390850 RepID=A0A6V7W1F6_MELEN|nr:unnamed protein product [Meloidogyne enterolobii]
MKFCFLCLNNLSFCMCHFFRVRFASSDILTSTFFASILYQIYPAQNVISLQQIPALVCIGSVIVK